MSGIDWRSDPSSGLTGQPVAFTSLHDRQTDCSRMASADVRQTLFRCDVDNKLNHSLSKGTKIVDMVSFTA